MRVAVFYRADLITNAIERPCGYACVIRGDSQFEHGQAVEYAKRHGADAYQLCEGAHLYALKPVSLTHDIRGL